MADNSNNTKIASNSPLTDMLRQSSTYSANYNGKQSGSQAETSTTQQIVDVVVDDSKAKQVINSIAEEFAKARVQKITVDAKMGDDVLAQVKELIELKNQLKEKLSIDLNIEGLPALEQAQNYMNELQSKINATAKEVIQFSDGFNQIAKDSQNIKNLKDELNSVSDLSAKTKNQIITLIDSLNGDIDVKNYDGLTNKLATIQDMFKGTKDGAKFFQTVLSEISGNNLTEVSTVFNKLKKEVDDLGVSANETIKNIVSWQSSIPTIEAMGSALKAQGAEMDSLVSKAQKMNTTKLSFDIDETTGAEKLKKAFSLDGIINDLASQRKELEAEAEKIKNAGNFDSMLQASIGGTNGSGANDVIIEQMQASNDKLNALNKQNKTYFKYPNGDTNDEIIQKLSGIGAAYDLYSQSLKAKHDTFMELVGSEIEAINKSESELKASFKDGIISPDELNKGLEEYETKRKELHEQIRREQEQDKRGIQSLIEGQARAIDAAGDNANGNFAMMDYGGTLKSNLKGIENSSRKASRELTMAGVGLKPQSLEQTLFSPRTLKNTGARMSAKLQGVNIGNMQNIAKKNASKANYINNNIDGVMGGLSGALEKGNVSDIQKYSGELTNIQKMVSGKQDIKSLKKSAQMKTNGNKELEGIKKAAKDQIASQKELVGTLIEFYHQLADSGKATPEQIKEMKSLEETMGDLIDAEEESSDKISDSVSGISSGISNIISTVTTVIGSIGDVLSTSMGARLFDWFKGSSIGQGINNFVEEKTGITDALNNIPTGVAQEIALNPYKVYDYIGMSNFNPEGYQQEAIKMEQTLEKIHFSVAQTNTKYGLSTDPTYADNLAKYLHSATNGVVDYEDFSNNYAAVGKAGIKENAGQIAEYATLMDKVGAMDSSDVISTLKTLYVNMDLTAEKSVQMVNRIAQAAKTSKVSVSDYAQAVTSIADGYRRIGLDAEDALNVMGNLMDAGYSFKDAQEMASTFGNSLSTFSNNNSDVILAGLMNGQTDPYKMLADAQDVTADGWGKSMAQGMQSILNMKESMFGKGSSLAKYQMLMTMQNDFGFSQKQSSEMYHKLESGQIGSLEDLLDEIAEGGGNESLEEINSKLVGEAQNLGTQVGSLNSMMAQFEDKAMNEGVPVIQNLINTLTTKGEDGESFFDKNLNDMQKTLDFDYEQIGNYLGSELGKYTQSNARDVKDLVDSVGTIGGLLEKIFPLVAGIAIAVGAKAVGGAVKGIWKGAKWLSGKLGGGAAEEVVEEGVNKAASASKAVEGAVKAESEFGGTIVEAEEAAANSKNIVLGGEKVASNLSTNISSKFAKYTTEDIGKMLGNGKTEEEISTLFKEAGVVGKNGTYTTEEVAKVFGTSANKVTGLATETGVAGQSGIMSLGAGAPSVAGVVAGGALIAGGVAVGVGQGIANKKNAKESGMSEGAAFTKGLLAGSNKTSLADSALTVGKYTAIGAGIGTLIPIPGVGTLAGAGVGAMVGLGATAYNLIDNATGNKMTKGMDSFFGSNSEGYNRIASGIDDLNANLQQKYEDAGFDEETAQLMADGLSQFGDKLEGADSKTMDAFAKYYADAVKDGMTPADAVTKFKENQTENTDKVIEEMKNMGDILLNMDGSIKGDDTAELVGEDKMAADATWDKWMEVKDQAVTLGKNAGKATAGGDTTLANGRAATMQNIVKALGSYDRAKQAGIEGIYNDIQGYDKKHNQNALETLKSYNGNYDKLVEDATYNNNIDAQVALQSIQDSLVGVGGGNIHKGLGQTVNTLKSYDSKITDIRSGKITDYTKKYMSDGEKQISEDLKDLKDATVGSTQFDEFWNKYSGAVTQSEEFNSAVDAYMQDGMDQDAAIAQATADTKEHLATLVNDGMGIKDEDAEELSKLIGVEVAAAINGTETGDGIQTDDSITEEQSTVNKAYDIWSDFLENGLSFHSDDTGATNNLSAADVLKGFTSSADELNKNPLLSSLVSKNKTDIDNALYKKGFTDETANSVLSKYKSENGEFNVEGFLNAAQKDSSSAEAVVLTTLTNNLTNNKKFYKGKGSYIDENGNEQTSESDDFLLKQSDNVKNIAKSETTNYKNSSDLSNSVSWFTSTEQEKLYKELTNGKYVDKNKNPVTEDSLKTILEDSSAWEQFVQDNKTLLDQTEWGQKLTEQYGDKSVDYYKKAASYLKTISEKNLNVTVNGSGGGDSDSDGDYDDDGSGEGGYQTTGNAEFQTQLDKYFKDNNVIGSTDGMQKMLKALGYSNGYSSLIAANSNAESVKILDKYKGGSKDTNTTTAKRVVVGTAKGLSAAMSNVSDKNAEIKNRIKLINDFIASRPAGNGWVKNKDGSYSYDIDALNNYAATYTDGSGKKGAYTFASLTSSKKNVSEKDLQVNLNDTSFTKSTTTDVSLDMDKMFKDIKAGTLYSLNNLYQNDGNGKKDTNSNNAVYFMLDDNGKVDFQFSRNGGSGWSKEQQVSLDDFKDLIKGDDANDFVVNSKTTLRLLGKIDDKVANLGGTTETTSDDDGGGGTPTPEESGDPNADKNAENLDNISNKADEMVDTLNGTGYLGAGQLLFTAQSFGSNSSLSGQSLATTDWEKQTTKITSAGGGLVAPDAQRYSYALANSSVNTYASLNKSLQASATAGNARTTASVNIQVQGILDSVKKAVQDSLEQSGVNVVVQAKESNTYG